eukprot:scaffold33947_cov76-Attheya_sp.AAC.2
MANDAINAVPSFQNAKQKTPQQLFVGTTSISVNPKHWKPFGCPVYILDTAIQSSHSIFHKWKQRSRAGRYLYRGSSPQYERNVARLVLDRVTGLIKAGFVHQALQDKKKSKSQQEIIPPAIPMNKRKCSRNKAVTDSEGAKRLQTKQSQNLGPMIKGASLIDKGKLKPESQNQDVKVNWQDTSSKQWQCKINYG